MPRGTLIRPNDFWTAEMDARLMEAREKGYSAARCAEEVQPLATWPLTRNAILGRVYRLRWRGIKVPQAVFRGKPVPFEDLSEGIDA